MWLFSTVEVGITNIASDGTTYPLFTDNASRIKYMSDGAGTAYAWWTRTTGNSAYFRYVNGSGVSYNANAVESYGVCLGLCV